MPRNKQKRKLIHLEELTQKEHAQLLTNSTRLDPPKSIKNSFGIHLGNQFVGYIMLAPASNGKNSGIDKSAIEMAIIEIFPEYQGKGIARKANGLLQAKLLSQGKRRILAQHMHGTRLFIQKVLNYRNTLKHNKNEAVLSKKRKAK